MVVPEGSEPWARTHASTPCVVPLPNGLLRTFFTTRDDRNRSHIACIDLDPDHGFAPMTPAELVLEPGGQGLFDDSGVAAGTVVPSSDGDWLYYLGWNLKVTVPWMNTIGLARRRTDTDLFEKVGRVPVMDRSEEDPFSLSYPCVLREDETWRMWYGSNLAWGAGPDSMAHVVKYAESRDGLSWTRTSAAAVELRHVGEFAISRPSVRRVGSGYEMFYCFRGRGSVTTYRIGYATSPDGLAWRRLDSQVGIDVSPAGWDAEMICYPHVFDHGGKTWMLYNGNGYGRTGFGLAELVES